MIIPKIPNKLDSHGGPPYFLVNDFLHSRTANSRMAISIRNEDKGGCSFAEITKFTEKYLESASLELTMHTGCQCCSRSGAIMNADAEISGCSKPDVLVICTFFLEGSRELSSKMIGEAFRFKDRPGIGFGLFSITPWIPEGWLAMESNVGSVEFKANNGFNVESNYKQEA